MYAIIAVQEEQVFVCFYVSLSTEILLNTWMNLRKIFRRDNKQSIRCTGNDLSYRPLRGHSHTRIYAWVRKRTLDYQRQSTHNWSLRRRDVASLLLLLLLMLLIYSSLQRRQHARFLASSQLVLNASFVDRRRARHARTQARLNCFVPGFHHCVRACGDVSYAS